VKIRFGTAKVSAGAETLNQALAISVVIPCFNDGAFLMEALKAVWLNPATAGNSCCQ
jgi:hypothetical protein